MPEFQPAQLDVSRTICLALLFPVLRWVLNVHCFQPLAFHVLRPIWEQSSSKVTIERRQLAVEKFSECSWKLVVYSLFTGLGITSLWGQSWVFDTQQLWIGWPTHNFSLPMQLLYNLELGFYISSIFMILFWEIRRKDFAAMFSHHIATVALVAISSHCRLWRVGVLIMLLHDANDVFMEGAKLAKYSKREGLAVVLFATFAVAWLVLRLLFFPFVVIRSTMFEAQGITGMSDTAWWLFNGLLSVLVLCHCYWYSLILRIVYIQLTTGNADDVREEDDD